MPLVRQQLLQQKTISTKDHLSTSKYGKNGFVRILPLEVDILITDTGLGEGKAKEIREMRVQVELV
jgi:DeoR/GlpR family transcriptional regulator of sugar metabolism